MADIPRNPLFNPLARKMPPAKEGGWPIPFGLITQPTPIATRQQDWPLCKPPKPRAVEYIQPRSIPLWNPQVPLNGGMKEWPLATRKRPEADDYLYWPMPTALVTRPFNQTDWPLPKRLPAKAIGEATGRLVQIPFAQYDWPLTARARGKATGESLGRLVPIPFSQYDWPLPARIKRVAVIEIVTQLTPELVLPFAQYDWPLAKRVPLMAWTNVSIIPPEEAFIPPVVEEEISRGYWPERHKSKRREQRPPALRQSIRETIEAILNPPPPLQRTDALDVSAPQPLIPLTEAERAQVIAALMAVPEQQLLAYGLRDAVEAAAQLIKELEQDDEEAILLLIAMTST